MNKPKDEPLYEKIKKKIFSENTINSAYRSGLLVKEYKKQFKKKYPGKEPFSGAKTKQGLSRWYKEDWKNQRGNTGYKDKGDIYRPTKVINKKTPKTFDELTYNEITKAMRKKKNIGRVDKF
jgi:hypothetical protein